MPPRARRTLNFLSVGEQLRIEHSCDFRLEDAFPPSDDHVPDVNRMRDLCDAATEVARILEGDNRFVQEAKNDVMAMIDDWKRTDDDLQNMVTKLNDLQFEHSTLINAQTEKAVAAVNQLRSALTTDASTRVSRRCWECDESLSRLKFLKKNTGKMTDESAITCSICLTRPIKAAFIPCGHCFCSECADKAGEWCYMCRTKIHRTTPLFY